MTGTIAVTGAAGFIGSNLVRALLAQGYRVVAVDNLTYGLKRYLPEGTALSFHEANIRWASLVDLFAGVDMVVHLAALCDIPYGETHPMEVMDVNVMGTVNVFQAAQRQGVKKVIYAETGAIYEATTIRPTPETEFCPRSLYGVSKGCNHLTALAFQSAYGLKTVGLRFAGVYGPYQDWRRKNPAVMSSVMRRLRCGESPILYEGDEHKFRDFIYVDDVVSFITLCLEDSRTDNQVYNVSSMTSCSIEQVVNDIILISGSELEPKLCPAPPPGPQSLESVLCDNSKARALGWNWQVGLYTGLERMWQFMLTEPIC